ncbi:type IV pilus assembly protein PilM [Patescibacteria group bacterium]|nr:type IV pilus assembly protein PilM [Patescibacteria group bacterium]
MGLFSKQESYLGVDIGTASIKACELTNKKGQASLTTYGLATLPNDLIKNESSEVIVEVTAALKKIVQSAGVTTKKVVASLPAYAVFTFEIDLPKMDEDKLKTQVRFEAEKYIPAPIAEMVVDWEIVEEVLYKQSNQNNQAEGEGNVYYRILITAAPRNLVTRYSRIFVGAGLKLESLETEAMALIRALMGEDKGSALILDIGATATDICLVDGGFPRLSRGIEFGGNLVTDAIAKSLNIDKDRAEQFKRDQGIYIGKDESDIPASVGEVTGVLVNETKKILNIFEEKRGKQVEKLILTGGSARLKGLGQLLAKDLGVKAYAGNPWARVETPAKVDESVKKIAPEFAVSVGLAMRNIY